MSPNHISKRNAPVIIIVFSHVYLKLMMNNQLIKGFKSYLQLERSMSLNTVDAYIHDVQLLVSFLATKKHDVKISEVDYNDLVDFITFVNDMEFGAYSQARIISGIKAFFKYLVIENLIELNPSELVESPNLGRKIPDVLSIEDIEAIINAVDLSHPEGERNKAILETLYGCGLRVSELVNLTLLSYHPDEMLLSVTGKGNKQRLVPLGEHTVKQVNIYLEHIRSKYLGNKQDNGILFLNRRGNKLTRQMIYEIVKKHSDLAGIRKRISPHSFRHAFATHLVQNGADLRVVQELLGHVSIMTTEIYTHINNEDLRNAVDKFHPRNRNDKEI